MCFFVAEEMQSLLRNDTLMHLPLPGLVQIFANPSLLAALYSTRVAFA